MPLKLQLRRRASAQAAGFSSGRGHLSTALATIDKDMLAQWHGKPAADGTHPV